MAGLKLLILALFVSLTASAQTCQKGEYLTVDGRCLHDQTGEHHPAGDGCNTVTCTDAACHSANVTAMYCSHGDDPASAAAAIAPSPLVGNGTLATTTIYPTISSGTTLIPTTCVTERKHWWSKKRTGCRPGDPK